MSASAILRETRVRLSTHAVNRFRDRWRKELAYHDARRELFFAFERAVRIDKIEGGVLYETDDQERIPLVVREHKRFGALVVTVLPAGARSLTYDETSDLERFGRLYDADMPQARSDPNAKSPPAIKITHLTASERHELACIERETAGALEAVERMRYGEQPRIITGLRSQLEAQEVSHKAALDDAHRRAREAKSALRIVLLAVAALHDPPAILTTAIGKVSEIDEGFLTRAFLDPESIV